MNASPDIIAEWMAIAIWRIPVVILIVIVHQELIVKMMVIVIIMEKSIVIRIRTVRSEIIVPTTDIVMSIALKVVSARAENIVALIIGAIDEKQRPVS